MAADPVRIDIEDRLSIDDNDLLNELEEEINGQGGRNDQVTRIQRVPRIMLRQGNFEEYYKPSQIAIGPLHANSKRLRKRNLKLALTASFIIASGQTRESLLRQIKRSIPQIKERFDSSVTRRMYYDDEELARMLFLDGCSILQFIRSYLSDDLRRFNINSGQAVLIQQDLFLLENQIPFQVLVLLMNLSSRRVELIRNIYRFIFMNNMAPVNSYTRSQHMQKINQLGGNPDQVFQDGRPVHLLDLLRLELLFDDGHEGNIQGNEGHIQNHFSDYRRSFRNVQDLKAAGIKLKPSYTCGLRSVYFTTRFFIAGRLMLPPLIVDDSTARKLLNLVAYEMCPDNHTSNYAVTSYLSFLDSLIDSEQDVKDLRSVHVVRNHLSSDAEVAHLFNTIGKNLVPHDAYFKVKNEIQSHYERRCVLWTAEVYVHHFKTPLTILALLAAAAALALTAVQAYYAIHPKKS